MFNKKIIELTEKIIKHGGYAVSYEDVCELAHLPEKDTMDLLFCAHKIKKCERKKKPFCVPSSMPNRVFALKTAHSAPSLHTIERRSRLILY